MNKKQEEVSICRFYLPVSGMSACAIGYIC